MVDNNQLAFQAARQAARENYGRLVAILARRTRDLSVAEDALAEAFASALKDWSVRGVPDNPEAWLIAVAKRKHLDAARKDKSHGEAQSHLILLAEEVEGMSSASHSIPDERLGLMFACAHPAIDETVRAALILQAVLGFTAEQIAEAFLVSPSTMGQRLSRAKAKIKLAGIPFRVPERAELSERLETVLDAVYACFSQGWNEPDPFNNVLTSEALWLGRLLVQLLPGEPECLGLLALMLLVQSRRDARRGADGIYVRLSMQDVCQWMEAEIGEAEALLSQAGKMGLMGRYQIEAAIQSVHAARRLTGETDWPSLCLLYQGLYQMTNSVVVKLNWAAALAERDGVAAGLAALPDVSQSPALDGFQPFHAVRADLLARAGHIDQALEAYGRAISLTPDDSLRRFLHQQADQLRMTLS